MKKHFNRFHNINHYGIELIKRSLIQLLAIMIVNQKEAV